jgi:hypothetical protein
MDMVDEVRVIVNQCGLPQSLKLSYILYSIGWQQLLHLPIEIREEKMTKRES